MYAAERIYAEVWEYIHVRREFLAGEQTEKGLSSDL